jgi:hypothetical protein
VPTAEVVHLGGQSTAQIPDESLVHLWRSRRRLYAQHTPRLTSALVGWLVRTAMRRRAHQAPAGQREAYLAIAQLWR